MNAGKQIGKMKLKYELETIMKNKRFSGTFCLLSTGIRHFL